MADHFDSAHLIGHVKDATHFEVPRALGGLDGRPDGYLDIPQLVEHPEPIISLQTGFAPIDEMIEPLDLKVTKFMVLEVVAAVVAIALFTMLAQRISKVGAIKGRLWNLLETMLVFIRDEVARPAIGKHDADRFVPFLWTVFIFVLGCNLLGMVPWLGSPTGALATTGAMALITFVTVVGSGMKKLGPIGFWIAQVPHMELPAVMAPMKFGIFLIEVLALFIKHFVLAVRLLANMMAGHLVLAVLIAFIAAAWNSWAVYVVSPASILGATAFSLLELFVAFLQAYIFTFLAALFIGSAVHPH